jgi:hypothetical protein
MGLKGRELVFGLIGAGAANGVWAVVFWYFIQENIHKRWKHG